MKILVIGGTGFIGKKLVATLINLGYEVTVLARRFVSDFPAKIVLGNILDSSSTRFLIKKECPCIIIVLSWITEKNSYRSSPENVLYMNAVVDLGLVSSSLGVKQFIALGSCAEYGDDMKDCVAGKTKLAPLDVYSLAKADTFTKLKKYSEEGLLSLTWARVFQPYGKDQDVKRLIPYVVSQFNQNRSPFIQNINRTNDWITTRDIASALVSIIGPNPPLEIDIGTGISTSNMQIIETIAKFLEKEDLLIPLYGSNKTVDTKGLSVGKESYLLKNGWKPSDSIYTGIKWAISN